jgi:hypothetical protein
MADLTLKDGREIEIDLYQISIKEWRSLLGTDPLLPDDDEFALIGRIIGMKADEVEEIPQPDYKLITNTIIERSRNPVSDPN